MGCRLEHFGLVDADEGHRHCGGGHDAGQEPAVEHVTHGGLPWEGGVAHTP